MARVFIFHTRSMSCYMARVFMFHTRSMSFRFWTCRVSRVKIYIKLHFYKHLHPPAPLHTHTQTHTQTHTHTHTFWRQWHSASLFWVTMNRDKYKISLFCTRQCEVFQRITCNIDILYTSFHLFKSKGNVRRFFWLSHSIFRCLAAPYDACIQHISMADWLTDWTTNSLSN
jgi:hypothetical protein